MFDYVGWPPNDMPYMIACDFVRSNVCVSNIYDQETGISVACHGTGCHCCEVDG